MAKRRKKASATKKALPTKRSPAKKTARKKVKPSLVIGDGEPALPPKKRATILKKLRRFSSRPSHPSDALGPRFELNFDAPLPRDRQKAKRKPAKTKRKSTSK